MIVSFDGHTPDIADDAFIAPNATIIGRVSVAEGHHATVHGCMIGAGALVGINAVVLNGAVVGEGSLIGANALVPEGMQIPPKSLVVGSPAQVKRTLTDEQVAMIRLGADHYIQNGQRFKALFESEDLD